MKPKRYSQSQTQYIAYPLGGIGAGMFCLEGNGALSHFSLFHRPDLQNEPELFAALSFPEQDGRRAVLLEGPVPDRKIFGRPMGGGGMSGKHYGLPRFRQCSFSARFPFGSVELSDETLPLSATVTGWSPFIPGDDFDSCLPASALEYTLTNTSGRTLQVTFSFHCASFLRPERDTPGVCRVTGTDTGLSLSFRPEHPGAAPAGALRIDCDHPVSVDAAWLRGHPFHHTMENWKHIVAGVPVSRPPYPETDPVQSPGGSLYLPLTLPPHGSRTVRLRFCWYIPTSTLREDEPLLMESPSWADSTAPTYVPWYASAFPSLDAVAAYFTEHYAALRTRTSLFTDTLYASTLDDTVMDAVASNLCILKSPTLLRQADGKLWLWEGCHDEAGSCYGSCTHVWNYAQALCHLFPSLERSLRETEFEVAQEPDGYQSFRTPLPIRPATRRTHPAADGQLGGIIKVYRDYHICGDRSWLSRLWPRVRASIDYCISTWDKNGEGRLIQPHHTTYDIPIWGGDALAQTMYLSALRAAALLAAELGEPSERYERLCALAKAYCETHLWNGSYFQQELMYRELGVSFDDFNCPFIDAGHPEIQALLEREGPPYQYRSGCLSDGVIGEFMALCAGLPPQLSPDKTAAHLDSVLRYNFRPDLSTHANPQRGGYALGEEAGLLVCSWPHGDRPTLPLLYSEEIWTGIEYEVASLLAATGRTSDALRLVRAVRNRYDGGRRNPFNEYECGNWYGRALSSYSLLQAFTGVRYDAVSNTLFIEPRIPGDFSVFLCTERGFGLAGVRGGEPFFTPVSGALQKVMPILSYVPYQR